MKTKVKVILALTLTFMLMASLAVLASPQINPLSTPSVDNGTYTVIANINDGGTNLSGKQVTMLVYRGTPTDSTIIGIDQTASDSNGNVTFTFGTDASTPADTYTVLVGGEEVNNAVATTFTIASPTPEVTPEPTPEPGHTVSGVITPMFENPDFPELVTGSLPVVRITANVDDVTALYTATVAVNANDATKADYSIAGVATGTYVLEISKPGYVTRYVPLTVESLDVTVDDRDLMAGDLNADHIADAGDLGELFSIFNRNVLDDPDLYKVSYDLNTDGIVDAGDLGMLFSYFNRSVYDYNEEIELPF